MLSMLQWALHMITLIIDKTLLLTLRQYDITLADDIIDLTLSAHEAKVDHHRVIITISPLSLFTRV